MTFVEGVPQPFTVLAEDGVTHGTYYVTVRYDEVGASGAELKPDSLRLQNSVLSDESILSQEVSTAADGATEILITVKPGVRTDQMHISADLSFGAVSSPPLDGKTAIDLSGWTTFVITSADATQTSVYRIKVVSKAQAEITAFRVQAGDHWYDGEIDNAKSTVTVRDVDDSSLTSTKLVTEISFTGKTCSPTSGVAMEFAVPVIYNLSGDSSLAARTYTVTVLNRSGETIFAKGGGGGTPTPVVPSGPKITSFSVLGTKGEIDEEAGTITITLPAETDVTAVAPSVSITEGASVSPASGEVVNLSNPLVYTVTMGTKTNRYTVTVSYIRTLSQQLWDELAEHSNVVDHQVSHGRRIR